MASLSCDGGLAAVDVRICGHWSDVRIGLLAYGLDRPISGVTRVALELARALAAEPDYDVTLLVCGNARALPRDLPARRISLNGLSRLPAVMALGGPLIALAARRHRLQLVHDPVGISPFTLGRWAGRFKRVVTIHDAIAYRYPEGYPFLNNLLHRRYVPATLDNVDAVITVSQHARADLEACLRLAASRTHVVPLGVSPDFRPISPEAARPVLQRYGLYGPFVLSVGAQQARKNLPRLLEAFARLRRRVDGLRLVIAGPPLWKYHAARRCIGELGLEGSVVALGYVPDDALPALYSAARLFVFPSLYEGFGLPVLEALACGTPVVCSSATSLPEVAGDAALLVDAHDVDALAAAMERALTDDSLRADLRARGLARAGELTWRRTAQETLAVYRKLLLSSS